MKHIERKPKTPKIEKINTFLSAPEFQPTIYERGMRVVTNNPKTRNTE